MRSFLGETVKSGVSTGKQTFNCEGLADGLGGSVRRSVHIELGKDDRRIQSREVGEKKTDKVVARAQRARTCRCDRHSPRWILDLWVVDPGCTEVARGPRSGPIRD